jgi:hypothetical protein
VTVNKNKNKNSEKAPIMKTGRKGKTRQDRKNLSPRGRI